MLMIPANDSGNLQQVRDALEPPTEPRVKQPFPFRDWYMAIVRPNHEQDAADSFRRNNVRAYWPNYERIQTLRRRSNGYKPEIRLILTSIIPGYVFVPTTGDGAAEDMQMLIERISGAINIARTYSGDPLLLREADIVTIRGIEAGLNTPAPVKPVHPVPVKPVHNFKNGEKVRFTDDIMGRWPIGRIVSLARDGRIGVEVSLMRRKVVVTVFPHQIERA
jgi:transcription antitermination factor NusG